MNRQFVEV